MNSWISFIKSFYATERAKDNSKCRNRVRISQVARVYNCKKKAASKTVRQSNKFSQSNPMHKGKHTRKHRGGDKK